MKIPENIPEFQLRFLVKKTKFKVTDSWCSGSEPQIQFQVSKPVLQYSPDGVEWIDVPTVMEFEDEKY